MSQPVPCKRCRQMFVRIPSAVKSGNYYCKPCRALERREWLAKNPEKIAEINLKKRGRPQRRYLRKIDHTAVSRKLWANPVTRPKMEARSALRYAVRRGKIIRQPCEVCGAPKAHGHHDDYGKPLDVRWLCQKHHYEFHMSQRARK